jgi:YD repeat-containing protein
VARKTDAFAYAASGRLATITHPDATTVTYAYDTRGNLKSVKDERHAAANTLYDYDALDRLITVTQKRTIVPGTDIVTGYGYDAQNNLTSVTDPNGNVTTYTFDDFGRMRTQVSPVTGTTTYVYDAAGNILTIADANGATTTRTYDLANRLLTATSTRSGQANETVTWGYDDATSGRYGLGRLASMIDPAGVTTYEYDRRGLVRAEARRSGTCKLPPFTCTATRDALRSGYGHDANGNRTSVGFGPSGYPPQNVVTYTYDYSDRPYSASSARRRWPPRPRTCRSAPSGSSSSGTAPHRPSRTTTGTSRSRAS